MSELIAELRSKKAVLKQLKKELKAKRKKASKAQKKKAKEVLSTIKTAIKSANKAERKNIDLKDLLPIIKDFSNVQISTTNELLFPLSRFSKKLNFLKSSAFQVSFLKSWELSQTSDKRI